MAWLSAFAISIYYITRPLIVVLGLLVTILSPILHLLHYTLSAVFLPFGLLAKFETLYIYLGTAAFIGLITGLILHLFSRILISLLNLKPLQDDRGSNHLASIPSKQKHKKKANDNWQLLTPVGSFKANSDVPPEKSYSDFLEGDSSRHWEGSGLQGQVILEEEDDDDSEDF